MAVSRVDGVRRQKDAVSHLHEVVDGGLDLQVFTNQNIYFHLDVVVLVMHEIIDRKRLVVGQVY